MSHPLVHFGSEVDAPSAPADGRGLLVVPPRAPFRVHPVTHEPIASQRASRPQPKKIRLHASRSTVRASRSLPYPDGKYERRRQQREVNIDRRFEEFEADLDRRFQGKGGHEGYALWMAVKGSGRRDIVD